MRMLSLNELKQLRGKVGKFIYTFGQSRRNSVRHNTHVVIIPDTPNRIN